MSRETTSTTKAAPRTPLLSRRRRIGLVGLGTVMLLGGIAYASLFTLGVLPRIGFAPGFVLVDAEGGSLTSEDLRGSVVVYAITTSADEPAYRDTAPVMARVGELLAGHDGEIPVRLVSIVLPAATPDPADAALEAAGRTSETSTRWSFVSGRKETLQNVVRDGFGLWFEYGPGGEVRYDPAFVVVDGMGIIRARHRVGLPPADAIVRDIRSVLREAGAATGAARLAYEAAHLFQCYPAQ